MTRHCPTCGEVACFCPDGVKEPSIQWNGMRDAIAMARDSAETLAAPVPQDCQARAVGIAGNKPA